MKQIAAILFGTMLALGAQATEQEIPAGSWHFYGNSYKGQLVLSIKSASGNLVYLTGTVYGQPAVGTYDKRIRRINLLRMINPDDPSSFQWIKGYLFTNVEGGKITHTLAGTFGPFGQRGTANEMLEAAWIAEMTEADRREVVSLRERMALMEKRLAELEEKK